MKTSKSDKIKTKMDRIRDILIRDEETRRNDSLLIGEYWKEENPTLCRFGTAESLLRSLALRQISSPEEITRSRRKVQELYPHLRDTKADQERRLAEAQVRANIRYAVPDLPPRKAGEEPSLFDEEGYVKP